MIPKTIFDTYSDFQASNTKVNKSKLRSVIHKFLVQHWGGEAPIGAKASNEEVFKLIELLKELPAILLVGSMDILEKEFISKGIVKENSKSYKSAYKAFLDWAEVNNYFKKVKEENLKSDIQQKIFSRRANGTGEKRKTNHHNKTLKQPYALMAKVNKTEQLVYTTDYINNNLSNELVLFEKFRTEKQDCSKSTIQKDIRGIYRILGWLHRYNNVSLEELSLASIIKFIKLKVLRSDFNNKNGDINYHKYLIKKAMVREEAIELANENIKLIEEYLSFMGGHPRSKIIVISICIAVAKFIFRDEIGTDEYKEYSNLPNIQTLNKLSNIFSKKAKTTPPSIPHADKSIAWKQTFNVLEVLRERIHYLEIPTTRVYNTKKEINKQYISKKLRSQSTIINNLQTFLSLAFMILIPTDRSRTYYELEIGRTFVYGIYEEGSGRFTPVDKLEDKSKAIWWIHLLPDDYKIRSREYWGKMPNIRFDSDNDLYSYIDRWINEGREFTQECNHNYFFRQAQSYKRLNGKDWSSRIKKMFIQQTGIPVTPKELRKMFITHLNNIGATNAELRGAAHAMHHSQTMQESVYNSQTTMDRLVPIYRLNEKTHKEFYDLSEEEE